MARLKYDVFISHATEDKVAFAEPLAIALRRWGLKVWFDKFSLKVGDSLRASIERGLSRSRYGVVIYSPHFLAKNWTKAELDGLFLREMDGKKVVILPIWHDITSTEMKKALPIQAGKKALKSSEGVESVARSLVEVIRPKLLKLEVKKGLAYEATDSFIDIARAQHPGYDFIVHSGDSDAPIKPGTLARVTNNSHRIDIRISNPALVREPPKLKLAFEGEGAKKAAELYRTGKPQSWKAGECRYLSGNIPFMPPSLEGGVLMAAGPGSSRAPLKHVRLEIGSSDPVVFPLMEMRPTRAGVEEAEATIGHKNSPLAISLVLSLIGSRGVDCNLATSLLGHSFSQCEKAIKAIDGLRKGDVLRIIDIETEKVFMEGPCLLENLSEEPFPTDLKSLVSLAAQIERHFSIRLDFPESVTENDSETLAILDCLLNERLYGSNLNAKATIEKAEEERGAAQRPLVAGEPVCIFQEPTNYPGYFALFGKQIPAPNWGLYTEKCVSEGKAECLLAFDQAMPGDEFRVELNAQTPTFVRWKHSLKFVTPS
ncbi:MAG TPA: toll/interleukin-1 receptor domain-containing protein [Terracidiphilus sp.]|nr:toll/interleukin-1 receptor domain-containing protein [Terracidiphilus sp.]